MTAIRNMLPLLLALLCQTVVQVTTLTKIEAKCRQDVHLPCSADFQGNDYFSVTWYKKEKRGIIRKGLKDMKEGLYNFPRQVAIDGQNGLVLLNVTPADSGEYECAVSANVGGKNVNLFVKLTVPECEPEPTASVTTVDTERAAGNTTGCMDCSKEAPPLPIAWSLLGYGAVALTKILLSAFIIWCFHIWTRRKRRW